ncbi:MAG: TonB-dependent receptor [Sediminibacterium sp.]|nr:TonB-dependent receptor [Sediminibacterium sp.]
MYKILPALCCLLSCISILFAQSVALHKKVKNQFADSATLNQLLLSTTEIDLTEPASGTDEGYTARQLVPSVLHSGKDLFASTASFHFNARRFRIKGLDQHWFQVQLNGAPVNQLYNGLAAWSSWGGLNEVMNNNTSSMGWQQTEYGFGGPGSLSSFDLRASHLRPQTRVTSAVSNRSYRYRLAYTKIVPITAGGWAYACSVSYRTGNDLQVPGSFLHSPAYFLSVDKKIGEHLFSIVLLGTMLHNSRTVAATKEAVAISGSEYYNSGWGYQNGQKRNANTQQLHMPRLLLSHEFTAPNATTLLTTLIFSSGESAMSGLDWYKAADPRPDYYRYWPGFQQNGLLQTELQAWYAADPLQLQINWNRLYEANRNSLEVVRDADGVAGKLAAGRRAHYVVQERVQQNKTLVLSSRLNQPLTSRLTVHAAGIFQWQRVRFFKRVKDLLGSDFFVDWNQFAEDQLVNAASLQNDLNRPNRILTIGDSYGYDYAMDFFQYTAMLQLSYAANRMDVFGAVELSESAQFRTGYMRNGVFPLNSFGRSATDRFSTWSAKAGITYKINGRKYLFLHLGTKLRPPFTDDYYLSPQTRDSRVQEIQMERITGIELGYILHAPGLKFRSTAYLTSIKNGMNRMSFYHDGYRNLVNYALWNIHQLHIGVEAAAEIPLSLRLRINLALAAGRYRYTSRPFYSISIDNEDNVTEQGLVYWKHFPVPGTPQQAYSAGCTLQLLERLSLSVTGNYLADYWVSFNPIRRTYDALRSLPPNSDPLYVIHPEKLPDVFVADLSAFWSVMVHRNRKGEARYLQCFLSIGNLLNRSFISGGYEQLRFDLNNGDAEKFPSKYYYAAGTNYLLMVRYKL